MISLALDLALGRGGGGCLTCLLALGAVFMLCQCCGRCRLRDVSCIRWFLRVTGIDAVPDTHMLVTVQEAKFTGSYEPFNVRITVGSESAETPAEPDGNFRCPLAIFVEQGSTELVVDLMYGSTQLATLELDLVSDIKIGTPNMGFDDETFAMEEVADITRAMVTLSVSSTSAHGNEAFLDLLDHVDEDEKMIVEAHLEKTFREHFSGHGHRRKKPSHLELVGQACCGPVSVYGGWGTRKEVYLAVQGPPKSSEWRLGIWQTELLYNRGVAPTEIISLLRVMSIQPEPQRPEVFLINFMVTRTQKQRLVFERIDRSRDVWVECLSLLMELVHKERLNRHRSNRSHSPGRRHHRRGHSDHNGDSGPG